MVLVTFDNFLVNDGLDPKITNCHSNLSVSRFITRWSDKGLVKNRE